MRNRDVFIQKKNIYKNRRKKYVKGMRKTPACYQRASTSLYLLLSMYNSQYIYIINNNKSARKNLRYHMEQGIKLDDVII